jgi:hypothetical protein
MKIFLPAIILAQLYLLFLGCIFLSPAYLPERFATSFNFAGDPECWMERSSYMMFVSIMGSFGVLVFVVLGFVIRFIPERLINLPRREYWLAPQRRAETMNYVFRQIIWYACLMTCFFIGVHTSTIHANKIAPVRLPQGEFFTIVGSFLAGTLIWVLIFMRHFRRID